MSGSLRASCGFEGTPVLLRGESTSRVTYGTWELRGLYVWVPATGETGIKWPVTGQTECLRPAAGRGHLIHIHIHIYTYYLFICLFVILFILFMYIIYKNIYIIIIFSH